MRLRRVVDSNSPKADSVEDLLANDSSRMSSIYVVHHVARAPLKSG